MIGWQSHVTGDVLARLQGELDAVCACVAIEYVCVREGSPTERPAHSDDGQKWGSSKQRHQLFKNKGHRSFSLTADHVPWAVCSVN